MTAQRNAPEGNVDYIARLNLFDVLSWEGPELECGQIVDPIEGVDDCALEWWTGFSAGGGGGEVVDLVVDTGAAFAAGQAYPMIPSGPALVVDLGSEAEEVGWGLRHGFSTTGGDVPAMSLPDAVVLPPDFDLNDPPLAEFPALGPGDLPLRWDGSGNADSTMQIMLLVVAVESGAHQRYTIRCDVRDDGSFDIPEVLLAQLPSGWDVGFYLERVAVASVADAAGRVIHAAGRTSVFARTVVE